MELYAWGLCGLIIFSNVENGDHVTDDFSDDDKVAVVAAPAAEADDLPRDGGSILVWNQSAASATRGRNNPQHGT